MWSVFYSALTPVERTLFTAKLLLDTPTTTAVAGEVGLRLADAFTYLATAVSLPATLVSPKSRRDFGETRPVLPTRFPIDQFLALLEVMVLAAMRWDLAKAYATRDLFRIVGSVLQECDLQRCSSGPRRGRRGGPPGEASSPGHPSSSGGSAAASSSPTSTNVKSTSKSWKSATQTAQSASKWKSAAQKDPSQKASSSGQTGAEPPPVSPSAVSVSVSSPTGGRSPSRRNDDDPPVVLSAQEKTDIAKFRLAALRFVAALAAHPQHFSGRVRYPPREELVSLVERHSTPPAGEQPAAGGANNGTWCLTEEHLR